MAIRLFMMLWCVWLKNGVCDICLLMDREILDRLMAIVLLQCVYTEARMRKISEDMLADIDKETVDHKLNFDDTLQEPTVLPTRDSWAFN